MTGVTASIMENFKLKLMFDATLRDVYPNVFKVLVLKFNYRDYSIFEKYSFAKVRYFSKTPKEWYLNTVYRRNKKVIGESVTYFAPKPLLDYVWKFTTIDENKENERFAEDIGSFQKLSVSFCVVVGIVTFA